MPTVEELDRVAPHHPVLIHYLYQQTLLNTAAIKYFGYDQKGHPTYPGGTIEKDADGRPTGRLLSTPSGLLMYKTLSQAPKLKIRDQINSSLHFFDELNGLGITSVSDAGGGGMEFPDADPYEVIRYLHQQDLLTVELAIIPSLKLKAESLMIMCLLQSHLKQVLVMINYA